MYPGIIGAWTDLVAGASGLEKPRMSRRSDVLFALGAATQEQCVAVDITLDDDEHPDEEC